MTITGLWTGTSWGAYNGSLTLDLKDENHDVTGEVTLTEAGVGQTRARLSGDLSAEGHFRATLESFASTISGQEIQLPRTGRIEAQYHSDGEFIDGIWDTDLGTSGNFALIRTPSQVTNGLPGPSPPNTQGTQRIPLLHNRTDTLGAYRLDRDDLIGLAEVMRSGTKILSPAVNITSEGRGLIHVGVENVLGDRTLPAVIYEMFLSVNEPLIHVGNKIVTLTFKKNGPNTLFVGDYDRTWVEGKASEIIQFLKARESRAAKFLGKYGPLINSAIFLVLLGILPSIRSLLNRFEILAASFALLFLLLYSWRLAVSFKAYFREGKLPWYRKYENVWLTLTSVLLTALITYLIARYISR